MMISMIIENEYTVTDEVDWQAIDHNAIGTVRTATLCYMYSHNHSN